jgi:hypothetical protein
MSDYPNAKDREMTSTALTATVLTPGFVPNHKTLAVERIREHFILLLCKSACQHLTLFPHLHIGETIIGRQT